MRQRATGEKALQASPKTLVDILHQVRQHEPNALAYTFLADGETETERMTFGALDLRARAIGATLQHKGVAGARVLLFYPSGLDYIAAFFGCLYAGAIAVPMYPPHLKRPADRLAAVVADAQATFALTTSALLPKITQWRAAAAHWASLDWLVTDTIDAAAAVTWDSPDIDDDTVAFLQYTSGSTATPKGVMVSHGNLLHNQQMLKDAYEHGDDTVYVSWLPLYHDMGLIGNVLQSLYLGVPCILMPPISFLQRPVRWLQAISSYRATTSGGPNFAYDLCVRKVTAEQRSRLDLSSWTVAFNGAEPIRLESLERFGDIFGPHGFRPQAFYPAYGLAEGTLMVTGGNKHALPITQTVRKSALEHHRVVTADATAGDAQTLVGCGKARQGQRVVIVDPETRTICPPDRIGEIWVSGASVALGYWRRRHYTSATFEAYLADTGEGPFLRTGDLGFLDDEELFVTGRLKDVLIIRGSNHYPQDIELTVEQCHPSLRPTCGVAFTVEVDGEERLVVVQELERGWQPQLAHAVADGRLLEEQKRNIHHILGTIRRAVAEVHGLHVYAIVLLRTGQVAKTSSGKIQRQACKATFLAQNQSAIAAWQAGTLPPPVPRPPRHITTARAIAKPHGHSTRRPRAITATSHADNVAHHLAA